MPVNPNTFNMPIKKKVVKKKAARRITAVNTKRLQFCFEYLIDLDGTKAAIRAGYSKKTAKVIACQLLIVPELKEIIKAGTEAKLKKAKIDAQWVLREQVKVYERCMTVDPVLDKEGNQTGEFKFDSSGANKALDGVGKHVSVQAFKETVEVNASKDILDFFAGIDQSKGPPSERGK